MNRENPLNSSIQEDELVAYLDGELEPSERLQVEERLTRDDEYRARLQSLQQAWDLLDILPRSSVSDSFARTTVEMVAHSAEKEVECLQRKVKKQRNWSWGFGGGSALVAAIVGYIVVTTLIAVPDQNLLRQLPVLMNLDFYRQVDDVDFLRQLDQAGLFSSADRASTTMVIFDPGQTLEARRTQLLNASPTQLAELQSSQERLQRMTADEQRHLQRVHDELARDPQAARLRQVLENYVDWLRSLPSGKSVELRALPTEKRVAEIKRAFSDQEEQQFRRLAQNRTLPLEDTKVIFAWLDGWIEKNVQQIEAQLPAMGLERLRDVPDPQRRRMMMYGFYLKSRQERQERGGERGSQEVLAPDALDVRELETKLSPESQKVLARAQVKGEELRLVQEWTRAAVFSRMLPAINAEELGRFYQQELSAADRARLDRLPREEFQREIRRMFVEYRIRKHPLGRPFNKAHSNPSPRREAAANEGRL